MRFTISHTKGIYLNTLKISPSLLLPDVLEEMNFNPKLNH